MRGTCPGTPDGFSQRTSPTILILTRLAVPFGTRTELEVYVSRISSSSATFAMRSSEQQGRPS
eukprot:4687361-Pyramimonas_sp.AAC.1